jgi:penicillin-binding protein 1A
MIPGFRLKEASQQYGPNGELQKEWVKQTPEPDDVFEVPEGHAVKGVSALVDAQGRTLYRYRGTMQRLLPSNAARAVTVVMRETMTRGTGAIAANFGYRGASAGKTGTTNDYKDAWFIGFDRETTCGVWVGFDQPKRIVDRGYGATLALPIWVKIMNAAAAEGS